LGEGKEISRTAMLAQCKMKRGKRGKIEENDTAKREKEEK
jgi:hypothetical protein